MRNLPLENKIDFFYNMKHIFIAVLFTLPLFAGAQTMSDEDRSKMRHEAGSLVKAYYSDLNLITSDDETMKRFKEENIEDAIKNYFYSPVVYIYNDIAQKKERDADSLRIREYLEKVTAWYPSGARFECNFNINNPCPQPETEGEIRFFVVKVEVSKNLQGIYKFDNQMHSNKDSLDVFVKFVIKQDRPKLIFDQPKIYRIKAHKKEDCIFRETEETGKTPFLLSDDDGYERQFLRERAIRFVQDYAITLNIIGNPKINDRYSTLDYFESENTPVFNDIAPQMRIPDYPADDYLRSIERWYQGGAYFRYRNVKAAAVLASFDYVTVEVQVDRVLRTDGVGDSYKHRQRLSIMVKFPVVNRTTEGDEKKVVGLERSTPRISRIVSLPSRVNPLMYLAAGVQLLSANYFGDIAPNKRVFSTDIERSNLAVGFYLLKKLNTRWYARANFVAATLSGDDSKSANPDKNESKYRYIRNLHFRNRIREYSLSLIYEMRKNNGKFSYRSSFTPYFTAGIGVFRNKPEARAPFIDERVTSPWVDLRHLGTEGQGRDGYRKLYAKWQPIIPLGAGLRYKVNSRIDFNFEISGRIAFTDFIDDISGNYPNYDDFGNNNFASVMSNRVLEPNSAFTQRSRQEGLDMLIQQGSAALLTYTGRTGRTYNTINGYGQAGDKRGTRGNRDYYMFTGFQIHYLLNVGDSKGSKKTFVKKNVKHYFN